MAGKQNKARSGKVKGVKSADGGPDNRGDIPHRKKCSIETLSIRAPPTTQQVTFHQTTEGANITATAAAQTFQYNFQLANLDNLTAFQSLFDQYRIDAIRFSLIPDNNAIPIENPANTTLVQVYNVIDYDDSTALVSAAAAKQYDNCAIVEPAESLCRTFQPRLAVATYSGVFTSFGNLRPQWLDMASTTVQHYGVKQYIPAITVGQTFTQSWKVQIEYWVSFRSVF